MKKIENSFPFLYLEKCSFYRKNDSLIIEDKNNKQQIPLNSFLVLLFGPGVSFSSNAVSHLANNNCFVGISSSAQTPKIFLTTFSNMGNANYTLNQIEKFNIRKERNAIVKKLLQNKFGIDFTRCKCIKETMLKEARLVKKIYKKTFGSSFKRDYNRNSDDLNKRINIANNSLYNYCGSLIHLMGLSPHIGFLHGKKRNAFIFDLSEIIKTEEYYEIIKNNYDIKEMLMNISKFIYNEKQKKILEFIEDVFSKNT